MDLSLTNLVRSIVYMFVWSLLVTFILPTSQQKLCATCNGLPNRNQNVVALERGYLLMWESLNVPANLPDYILPGKQLT